MQMKAKNRIRKSFKYIYITIAIIFLLISTTSLLKNILQENMKTKVKEIYNYTNMFNYDYKINLKPNKYMDNSKPTDKTLVYVTNLIDTTNIELNYNYIGDKESNLIYTYSVVGKMEIYYTKDNEEQKIWEEEEKLIEENKIEKTGSEILIKENILLDLKQKNELLNEFKQQMGMTIEAKYIVALDVNVVTNIEEKEIIANYTPIIQVDLAEKTSKITGENNIQDTQYIIKEEIIKEKTNIFIIILDIILICISIIIIKYVVTAKPTNMIKNEFKLELNKILKICQDKIVEVSSKPNDKQEDIVLVKDFGEIFKVSEELFKPILYYFDSKNEEAWFSVITGTIIYRYILKR